MFEVRLKPGHPTGTFRRAGIVFTAEPVRLEKLPEEVKNDPWLKVTEIEGKAKGPYDGNTVEELKALCVERNIEVPADVKKKADFIALLVKSDEAK